jgi:hypothetical protein
VRGTSTSARRTDSSLGSATATEAHRREARSVDIAPGDPPHDAAALTPPAGGPAVDAGAPDTPKPPAITVQSPRPGTERRTGSLHVVGMPILSVTVDGKPHGDTPLTISLKPGKHRVRLQNVENNLHEDVSVIITEHQTTTIDRMPR